MSMTMELGVNTVVGMSLFQPWSPAQLLGGKSTSLLEKPTMWESGLSADAVALKLITSGLSLKR